MNKHIERMLNQKTAMVGSVADDKPCIKAMLVARREGSAIFYFDSNHGSQRVAHWRQNPAACLYFTSGPIYRGVMLTGTMEIIDDMETKKIHWTPMMKNIYRGGITDPDYCILKFTATSGRYYHMYESTNFDL
ncbi:MAG: pyridoxamine 5'-phosphate oxidase family protein [Propionibacteriaceae bacterium]|jgi:general stress protein 26|nr:pyridoxamine 5'-phosphate oxidase family protein [Propionibacteriaceae bacterium]